MDSTPYSVTILSLADRLTDISNTHLWHRDSFIGSYAGQCIPTVEIITMCITPVVPCCTVSMTSDCSEHT